MGRKAEWASQVVLVVKKVKVKVKSLSRVRLFATPWTIVYETPPSMEFSKQENWSGLPFPSPGDLPNPGIEPVSPVLQADAFITWATREVVGKETHLPKETQVGSLGWGDPLKKGTATHASILAWRIPWTEEPSRLQSIGLRRAGHDWSNLACMHARELDKLEENVISREMFYAQTASQILQFPLHLTLN